MAKDNIEYIFDYPVTTLDISQCVQKILHWIDHAKTCHTFYCANPHSLMVAENDFLFKQELHEADLLTPDGIGIVIGSRLLGGQIKTRITGSDIFLEVTRQINALQKKVFFLGSTEATLQKIKNRLEMEFPDIQAIGTFSPPFKAEFNESETNAMIEAINNFQPHVLWIGMTAPKQEKWLYLNKHRLDVPFAGAIGAVFDFYAGNIKRSSPFFQSIGLEWLPRLIQEPKRLWKRNFISNPKYLLKIIISSFAKKK